MAITGRYGDYRDFMPGGVDGPPVGSAPQQDASGNFNFWEVDVGRVKQYLQQHASDPAIIAAAQKGRLDDELYRRGYRVPHGWKAGMTNDGQVTIQEQSWWDKNKEWALPVAGIGAAAAAPAILGAIGGAAPATGVGIGETGAVTGLGGSGFGTGAGLGLTGVGTGVGLGETGAVTGLAGSGFGAGGGLGATAAPAAAASKGGILGTLGKYAGPIGKAGSILGSAAGAHAEGQRADEYTDILRDRNALERYKTELETPGKRLASSTGASMLKNWGPVSNTWQGPGSVAAGKKFTFEGGYRNPNLIDPRTKQLADDIVAKQLQDQLAGAGPPPLTPARGGRLRDDLLGGVGTSASILGAIFGK